MTSRVARVAAIVVVTAISVAAAACTQEDIVLGTLSNGPNASGVRCVTSEECGADAFCDHRSCHEPAGTCLPFPVSCKEEEHPVCGCDGITYFNDCLRRAAGVPGSEDEECKGEAHCGGPNETCPSGAVCARLQGLDRRTPCGATRGHCWVLPATCPPPSRPDRWDECGEVPGGLGCLSTCAAIQSGRAFFRTNHCQ
jgi:hypothetical protein